MIVDNIKINKAITSKTNNNVCHQVENKLVVSLVAPAIPFVTIHETIMANVN